MINLGYHLISIIINLIISLFGCANPVLALLKVAVVVGNVGNDGEKHDYTDVGGCWI